ncbi:MAG: MbtH family NRPS accessory protein [Elusimicrobiota bacterium]|nr:MbtH family NRPS accessory protein [Elusimicrobiota bacterium]
MEHGEDADKRKYIVVKNAEDQFSIWFDGRALPSGWVAVGKSGSKEECLSYIKEVWTDMRPASLRRYMESRPE